MLDKEKIFEKFKLPIEYLDKKHKLTTEIKQDLELIKPNDNSTNSTYNVVFKTNNDFDNMSFDAWGKYFSSDKSFLKDSQHFYKNINDLHNEPHKIKKMVDIWNKINNESDFIEKYQYIDWERLYFLNNSKMFLSILSFYNITSPILQLIAPLFVFITPFLLMKSLGTPITAEIYIKILLENLKNQPFIKLFISFNSMSLGQQIYGLLMLGLYIYNIYSNVLSCYKFYTQMKILTAEFEDIRKYLECTIENMTFVLNKTNKLNSYQPFNNTLLSYKNRLSQFLNDIRHIPKSIFNKFNIFYIGTLMKYYFTLWDSKDIDDIFSYSFGFNCYYNNLIGLNQNIQHNNMNICLFKKNKSIKLIDTYHPNLTKKVIKNTITLNKNKIITGPNASGKTTLLKAITINIILSQQFGYGFYRKCYITPYHHLHCYINIPDTNDRDSLFQSEARRCKTILDSILVNKKDNHFCIFDELYSGTNPYEAIATAHSYLNYISNKKNVDFILTTHYIKLCELFDKNKHIDNIHMKTLITNNKPNYFYKIKTGISKVKGGVHVLKQLKYPEIITKEASNILKKL